MTKLPVGRKFPPIPRLPAEPLPEIELPTILTWRQEMVAYILQVLREALSEERTDQFIDWLLERVKFPIWIAWAKPFIRKALDYMLPEQLLSAIEKLLSQWVEEGNSIEPPPA
jgi:hypothetical protein